MPLEKRDVEEMKFRVQKRRSRNQLVDAAGVARRGLDDRSPRLISCSVAIAPVGLLHTDCGCR
jgi:hypothetical protein